MGTYKSIKDNYRQRSQEWGEAAREIADGNNGLLILAWIIFTGLIIAFLVAFFVGVQSYVSFAAYMLQQFRLPVFPDILASLPIVGGILSQLRGIITLIISGLVFWVAYREGGWRAVCMIAAFVVFAIMGGVPFSVGTFLWLLINGLTIAWLFMTLDSKAMRGALRSSRQLSQEFDGYKAKDHRDKSVLRKLKGTPYFFVRNITLMAFIALGIDAIVNFIQYPPAESIETFFRAFQYGRFEYVNWKMFWVAVLATGVTEILFVAILSCWQWIQMHKRGEA